MERRQTLREVYESMGSCLVASCQRHAAVSSSMASSLAGTGMRRLCVSREHSTCSTTGAQTAAPHCSYCTVDLLSTLPVAQTESLGWTPQTRKQRVPTCHLLTLLISGRISAALPKLHRARAWPSVVLATLAILGPRRMTFECMDISKRARESSGNCWWAA